MFSMLLKVYNVFSLVRDVQLILKEIRRQTPRYTPEEKSEIKKRYEEAMRKKLLLRE